MTEATFSRIFVKTCVVTLLVFVSAFFGILAQAMWAEDYTASAFCLFVILIVIPFLIYQTVIAK